LSLGLRGGAKLHDLLGLFGPYGEGKLRDLARQIQAYAEHHDLAAAFRIRRGQDGLLVSFHPAAPDIVFSVEGGHVVMTAETIKAGPGYHAFVVGLIDYLSRHHQWVWTFRSASRRFADDTGFYHDRDFAALQATMAGEFAGLCEGLAQVEPCENSIPYCIWLPTDFSLATNAFAATSLGFRDRAFFEQPSPERFFPWWEQGLTAQTVKNMALAKMWLEVSWAPETDSDRAELEKTQGLIDRARALGAGFADDEGAGDIAALLRGETLATRDSAGRIGYWRQDIWYSDSDGWSVPLPAYYREDIGDDGQMCAVQYGDRAVYMRSGVFETPLTEPEWPDQVWEGCSEILRFETGDYRVTVQTELDDNDQKLWRAEYCTRDGAARIGIAFSAGDEAWAEKVVRSVQPPAGLTP
jgi:hypothetical protein